MLSDYYYHYLIFNLTLFIHPVQQIICILLYLYFTCYISDCNFFLSCIKKYVLVRNILLIGQLIVFLPFLPV